MLSPSPLRLFSTPASAAAADCGEDDSQCRCRWWHPLLKINSHFCCILNSTPMCRLQNLYHVVHLFDYYRLKKIHLFHYVWVTSIKKKSIFPDLIYCLVPSVNHDNVWAECEEIWSLAVDDRDEMKYRRELRFQFEPSIISPSLVWTCWCLQSFNPLSPSKWATWFLQKPWALQQVTDKVKAFY